MPSRLDRHPTEPSIPEHPANARLVPFATSEFPPPTAAGSMLKNRLFNDAVTVPEEPVSRVPVTVAEAFETKNKLPAKTATGAKENLQLRNVIRNLLANT